MIMASHENNYRKRLRSHSKNVKEGNKRRNSGDDKDLFLIDSVDTVYRYLCPVMKIGSIIGRGGDIIKQLRVDTKSQIKICNAVPGSDERVVTIYSASDETNAYGDSGNYICPAQDALFRVHDRVIEEGGIYDDSEGGHRITVRLLVPSDQIGCIIGKGGQIVQNIRSETGALIRILKDEHLPSCALRADELVQISGKAAIVKNALYQIAHCIHECPSLSQLSLLSAVPSVYCGTSSLMGPTGNGLIVGIAPLGSAYGGYKGDIGDGTRSLYSAPRDELSSKKFSLRIVCSTENIGGVIGKGGVIISQIRQDSGALIKVDSSTTSEGNDCLIKIAAKECFRDNFSPTIEAAVRLQPRCRDKVEQDSGIISFTTRLLVPTSQINCLLGEGGATLAEMRILTKAIIHVLGKDDLPKVASNDDKMVLISGNLDVAKDALIEVSRRLRAKVFYTESAVSTLPPILPYLPVSTDGSDCLSYDSRESTRHGRGHLYSGGYGSDDYAYGDNYVSYNSSQIGSIVGPYGAYGSYPGQSSAYGLSSSQSDGFRYGNYY